MSNSFNTTQPGHDQGIWIDSNCAAKERQVFADIEHVIRAQGFVADPNNWRKWSRGKHQIVLCLVDDIISATNEHTKDMPYLFDRHTTVISDNYLSCPTQFNLIRLPQSFFGIYAHDPVGSWQPDRSFCFSVNRLDNRRLLVLLELMRRSSTDAGYVNFNCQFSERQDPQPSIDDLRANFVRHLDNLGPHERATYRNVFHNLQSQIPIRNYTISHAEIHLRSFLNIVIETYGSDTSVTLSEKIFRAIVLPVPWTVYAGRYAVAYLESLGFDCLHDLIPHNNYDKLQENQHKIHNFISVSMSSIERITAMMQDSGAARHHVLARTMQAARHNREVLLRFKQQWSTDFDCWRQNLEQKLLSTS